ncbi:helix-turn-helix domain-containing protein [Candidatus Fukatsuia symbiotica]
MSEEIFTLKEACRFMKLSENTLKEWIRAGRLPCNRTGHDGKSGGYRILKTACIESVRRRNNDIIVKATGTHNEEQRVCQSKCGTVGGTVISLRRTVKELGNLLEQRTSGKHRSCTIA